MNISYTVNRASHCNRGGVWRCIQPYTTYFCQKPKMVWECQQKSRSLSKLQTWDGFNTFLKHPSERSRWSIFFPRPSPRKNLGSWDPHNQSPLTYFSVLVPPERFYQSKKHLFLGIEHMQINKTNNSKSWRTPKASIFPKKYHRGDRGTLRSRQGADGVPQQNLGRERQEERTRLMPNGIGGEKLHSILMVFHFFSLFRLPQLPIATNVLLNSFDCKT